jgi:hypothetical protein
VGSFTLRPGDSLTIPRMALSIGFIHFVSSMNAIQATGLLTLTPVGLMPPTEHASLCWTTLVRKKSIQSLSNLSFQPIIVMQSAKHWLRSDSVTSGKLMPKAAGRDTRRKGLRCSRT